MSPNALRFRSAIPYLLAAASASLMLWAVPPQPLHWIAWMALIPLLSAICLACSWQRAGAVGWLFGTLLVGCSIAWLEPAIRSYDDYPALVSMGAFVLVVMQAGLVWGISGALLWQFRKGRPAWPVALLAPVALSSAEFLMPTLFHWNLGFTQAGQAWITQVADITGVVGVSFLLAMVNGCLFDVAAAAWRRQRLPWRSALGALALVGLALGYSQWRIADIEHARDLAPKLRVGVVQGNLGLDEAEDPARVDAHLARYFDKSLQLRQRGAELIIWPEAAYPYLLPRDPVGTEPVDLLHWLSHRIDAPLLVGSATAVSGLADIYSEAYNSALLVAPDGRTVGRYDKQLLFPVAEYVPFVQWFPGLKHWFPGPRYTPGAEPSVLALGAYRIGPLICLEDTRPDYVLGLASLRPNLLVVLSSDARFGAEAAPHQHQALASFRSIELRLDMVRASQNGISAIIDATGRVRVQTRAVDPGKLPGVKAFGLTGTVALLDGPASLYARIGNVFAWLNVALALALLVGPRVRRRRS